MEAFKIEPAIYPDDVTLESLREEIRELRDTIAPLAQFVVELKTALEGNPMLQTFLKR